MTVTTVADSLRTECEKTFAAMLSTETRSIAASLSLLRRQGADIEKLHKWAAAKGWTVETIEETQATKEASERSATITVILRKQPPKLTL